MKKDKNYKTQKQIEKSVPSKEEVESYEENLALSIAREVMTVIKQEKISQNELCRRFGISSRTMDQIIHAKGNLTLSTIAKIASVCGKKPKIVWE